MELCAGVRLGAPPVGRERPVLWFMRGKVYQGWVPSLILNKEYIDRQVNSSLKHAHEIESVLVCPPRMRQETMIYMFVNEASTRSGTLIGLIGTR